MACGGGLDARLDIQQVLSPSGANHRSLCSEEVYEILMNYKDYHMAQEPEQMPRGGSIYLFNKKTKHFRKDGHNWKKRKGGKRDMEWNVKLKVGLRCYYACGEENENFKRRIYSIREKGLSDIVLVHYLEVKESLDNYTPRPSFSDDLLFSIVDFAPDWGYEDSKTKVLIKGRILNGQHAERCKWSCMFGEVEVLAEVLGDGDLRCYAPAQKAGRVSFFVTCSNRLACSEVKEFEYRADYSKYYYSDYSDETLNLRFENLLSSSSTSLNCDPTSIAKNFKLSGKISSLLKYDNDEWDKVQQCLSDDNFSWGRVNEQSLQPLKEKLYAWLLQKLAGGGKGPSVLDEGGQGVLHLGAALGYDWALLPMKIAGVSVDFRDVNGWTALHWAAFCGRERTVAVLIILGADPRALTHSTIRNPTSKTPADLAFEEGHFGSANYLVNRYEPILDEDNFVRQLLRSSPSRM